MTIEGAADERLAVGDVMTVRVVRHAHTLKPTRMRSYAVTDEHLREKVGLAKTG